jgi:hypothetical protein
MAWRLGSYPALAATHTSAPTWSTSTHIWQQVARECPNGCCCSAHSWRPLFRLVSCTHLWRAGRRSRWANRQLRRQRRSHLLLLLLLLLDRADAEADLHMTRVLRTLHPRFAMALHQMCSAAAAALIEAGLSQAAMPIEMSCTCSWHRGTA